MGETGRNGMTRSKDHMKDRRSMNPNVRKKSVLWRHEIEKHGGRECKFEMRVLETFNRDPLGRQSMEGMMIREADPEKLINNNEEWIQPGDIRAVFGTEDGRIGEGMKERIGGDVMDKITKEIIKIEREEKVRMEMIMRGEEVMTKNVREQKQIMKMRGSLNRMLLVLGERTE